MDEDYARLLRDWLQADPETPTPRPAFDEGDCHEATIPVPRPTRENRTRRGGPARSEAEERSRRDHPSNWRRWELPDRPVFPRSEAPAAEGRSEAEERSRRDHPSNWRRRQLPAEIPDRLAMPEEGSRQGGEQDSPAPATESRSEAEERSRRNHPSNWKRPGDR